MIASTTARKQNADGLYGYVELQDFFGSDELVAETARECYQSEAKSAKANRNLIKKLITNGHTSVFEHCVFRFKVHCPIFIARQWMRHRIGSYTEMSMRHVKGKAGDFWYPEGDSHSEFVESCEDSYSVYEHLIATGLPLEEARGVLPVAMYTTFVWTVNARSLMNYLEQRTAEGAQALHRDYAYRVLGFFQECMPITYGSWMAKRIKATDENKETKESVDGPSC